MNSLTHISFAFFLASLLYGKLNTNPVIFITLAMIASLLPDIDSEKSRAGKKIWPIAFIIRKTIGHRTIFHSVFLAMIVSLAISIFSVPYAAAFFLGYASHIILDSLTREGTMPFYPSKARIRGFLKTGGMMDYVFSSAFIAAGTLLLILFPQV